MFEKQQKRILLIAGLIFVAVLTISLYIIENRQALKREKFEKPVFEKNAVQGAPSGLKKEWNYNTLKIQEGKTLALCATPAMSGNRLQLYLTSSAENSFWLKIRVFDEKKKKLGECGLIKPGNYIETISLSRVAKHGEKLTLYLMMYEKETYQSAGAATIEVVIQ